MMERNLAILLAVYNPREDWLIELLDSLNRQTYPSITLYVRDDASPNYSMNRLKQVLCEHITAFPYILRQTEVNCGSNQTFEHLVRDASDAHYVAFCDQDDIWLPDKLTNSVALLENSPLSPALVCSNVSVIDGSGRKIATSLEQYRRRHVLLRGRELARGLIYRNFVMGCTVVMERRRVMHALPFPNVVVHDHYLAFCAAIEGAIDYLEAPQMHYRIYGGNQTGVMVGIESKHDYAKHRILAFGKRLDAFSAVSDIPALREARAWYDSRIRNFNRERGGFRGLWRLRAVNPSTSLFELFALRLPAPLFRMSVRLIVSGRL